MSQADRKPDILRSELFHIWRQAESGIRYLCGARLPAASISEHLAVALRSDIVCAECLRKVREECQQAENHPGLSKVDSKPNSES